MYQPDPLMPLHLSGHATRLGDLAQALWSAIYDVGLRLPARRDIAEHSWVSEATISRRFRDVSGGEERVARVLASARERTYPPGWERDGWSRWLPTSDIDLRDVGVWTACLALATHAPSVREAVCSTWEHEHRSLVRQLTGSHHSPETPCDPETGLDAQIVLSLLLGLSIRRLLDPDVTAEHASDSLRRLLAALGHATAT